MYYFFDYYYQVVEFCELNTQAQMAGWPVQTGQPYVVFVPIKRELS